MPGSQSLHIVDHPAVADRLARLRDRSTPTPVFRTLIEELGAFLAYEATRSLPLRDERITTPLIETNAQRIATRPVVAPVLRAGLGLLPGFLSVIDDAVVAHLGFYRDPASLRAVPYYANVPPELADRHVFVLDPMLATGQFGRCRARCARRTRRAHADLRLRDRGAGGRAAHSRGASRTCHIVDGGAGCRTQRSRLHRAGAWATPAIACSEASPRCRPRCARGNV